MGFHAQFVLELFSIGTIRTDDVFSSPVDHFDVSRNIASIDSRIIAKVASIAGSARVTAIHDPVVQERKVTFKK